MTTTVHSGIRSASSASRRVRGVSGVSVVKGGLSAVKPLPVVKPLADVTKGFAPTGVLGSSKWAGGPSPLTVKFARSSAVLSEMFAQYDPRDAGRQEAAARACADYAEVASTEVERARYTERAAIYAAQALHLRWVAERMAFTAARLQPRPSHVARLHNLRAAAGMRGLRLSDPTGGRDRHPVPRSVSPHQRACILLAAPGAPNGPHPALCRVSLDRPSISPAVHTH